MLNKIPTFLDGITLATDFAQSMPEYQYKYAINDIDVSIKKDVEEIRKDAEKNLKDFGFEKK